MFTGDGGYVFALEKRGYVKAGPWTPEAVIEHPEAGIRIHSFSFTGLLSKVRTLSNDLSVEFLLLTAVVQLHREFQRAGADVLQALTFYASEDKLENRGNYVAHKYSVCVLLLALLYSTCTCMLVLARELSGKQRSDKSTSIERSRVHIHERRTRKPHTVRSVRVFERGGV